jgi:hypothetical protein
MIYVKLLNITFHATVINKSCNFPNELRNDLIKQHKKVPG